MDVQELANRFKYHPPVTNERINAHEQVRGSCFKLAVELNELLPEGREKSVVMTHLEDVMMWANASIARQPSERLGGGLVSGVISELGKNHDDRV